MMSELVQSSIQSLPLVYRGKVRDSYAVGDDKLLIIASDRISAFDVILGDPIPKKGKILTALTDFWFKELKDIVPNHLTDIDPTTVVSEAEQDQVRGRAVVAKRLKPILVECVARGYLAGSGWKEYQENGMVCGVPLPAGLKKNDKLPEPIFTPAAKAEVGSHDENITFEQVCKLVGNDIAEKIREYTLTLYKRAADYAATKGIIISDTKFEFGLDEDGTIVLMDEVLTPDSSRFWPADQYEPGKTEPSFDKQFIRDWLETQTWNKQPPAPKIPADVLQKTSEKYEEALIRLTGKGIE
ncbi:MAG: phosphoribosylaminoimidazolesuccinocarboxamide synthase [Burkholderiaceae bacterium]|nr:phosphoribosylaminoimidazolesuccinocarboxamide synthase [Burkholderiaceae bacterium]